VFHDIAHHETVFNKKMAGDNPSIPVMKYETGVNLFHGLKNYFFSNRENVITFRILLHTFTYFHRILCVL